MTGKKFDAGPAIGQPPEKTVAVPEDPKLYAIQLVHDEPVRGKYWTTVWTYFYEITDYGCWVEVNDPWFKREGGKLKDQQCGTYKYPRERVISIIEYDMPGDDD